LNTFLRQGVRDGFKSGESWQLLAQTMNVAEPTRPRPAATR
jgi:hypothetical protein